MRTILLLSASVIVAGCWGVTVHGPITGKPYLKNALIATHLHWDYYEECREAYVRDHPETPAETKKAILEARLLAGMSGPEVEAAWGSNYYVDNYLGRELWIFDFFDIHHVLFDGSGCVERWASGSSPYVARDEWE